MSSRAVVIFILFIIVSLCGLSVPALVLAGPVSLPASAIIETEFSGKTFTCGFIDGQWMPGKYTAATERFQSYSDKLKAARKKAKSASGSTRTKLLKLIKRLVALLRDGTTACASSQAPTPVPSAVPTGPGTSPTPTATPSAAPQCFDSNRNTLPGALEIPSGLTGNFSRGQTVWSSTCASCHLSGSKSARTYNDLAAIYTAPMFLSNITNQQRADLAAYLNYPNC